MQHLKIENRAPAQNLMRKITYKTMTFLDEILQLYISLTVYFNAFSFMPDNTLYYEDSNVPTEENTFYGTYYHF